MLTGIIDYNAGNLRSVVNALEALGRPARVVGGPDDVDGLEAVILPGQGSFGDSVRNLMASGLWEFVVDWIRADRPYFGICLGYQLLFESSEESPGVRGLDVLPGRVVRFPPGGLKVPHMGWNTADPVHPDADIWRGLGNHPHFYFVHSFYPEPADRELVGTVTRYGVSFASSIARGNLVATQFHPEKSQALGLRLLANFFAAVAANADAA